MVEDSTDQVDLLKAFDDVKWRNLQERYAYHFGDERWLAAYAGQQKYGKHTRWQDPKNSSRSRRRKFR